MAIPTLRAEIKFLLLVAFWGLFGAGYFERFPLPAFLFKGYVLTLGIIVGAAAWGYGSILINRLIASGTLEASESIVFSMTTGFGILALLIFFAGMVGLWTRPAMVILVGLGLLLGWGQRKNRHPPRSPTTPSGMTAFLPFLLIAVGAVLSLLVTFTPITYYDSLVYHLALPQAYIQAHHWIGRQELIYSAFPQNMEMLWTLGLLMSSDILSNILGWSLAVLGVLAVYFYALRFFGRQTAQWAAALLSLMTAYLLLSSGGYVDVGLTVFSFLSFYAICLWRKNPKPGLLVIAGALAGWALGVKYTGAIPFLIGGGIILSVKERRLRHVSIYAGTALILFSPWLAKNLYYFGNPVFPFLYKWNSNPSNPWLGMAADGYFRGLTEYTSRSGFQLFKLMWDAAVHGLDLGGGMDVLGDLGWAPLFAFLPAVWLARKRSPELVLVLLYGACFFVPWGMSRPVLRFLLPLAPFLALGAAYGWTEGIGTQPKVFRMISGIFLGLLVISNVMLLFEVSDVLSLFKVPLGFESRSQYLSQKLNYFDAAQFINALPENSLTAVVGDQRSYYYNKPVLVFPIFNKNPLADWANDASSSEDLAARLKTAHITHLLINRTEFKRLESAYHFFPLTAKGQANWTTLLSKQTKSIYSDASCDVLVL